MSWRCWSSSNRKYLDSYTDGFNLICQHDCNKWAAEDTLTNPFHRKQRLTGVSNYFVWHLDAFQCLAFSESSKMSLSASSVSFSFSSGRPSKPSSCGCVLWERLLPQIKEISSPQILFFTLEHHQTSHRLVQNWFNKSRNLWMKWIWKKHENSFLPNAQNKSVPWFSMTHRHHESPLWILY